MRVPRLKCAALSCLLACCLTGYGHAALVPEEELDWRDAYWNVLTDSSQAVWDVLSFDAIMTMTGLANQAALTAVTPPVMSAASTTHYDIKFGINPALSPVTGSAIPVSMNR
jgi:hypothetical protein